MLLKPHLLAGYPNDLLWASTGGSFIQGLSRCMVRRGWDVVIAAWSSATGGGPLWTTKPPRVQLVALALLALLAWTALAAH